jgi:DNA-binding transcriptional LysR family regulator
MHKNLGFDRLKVFYYVFSKKSVIAAANSLYISQSAVSQSIQKLESELKAHLFTRMHKQLIPTTAGENLFAVVNPFIKKLDVCLKNFEQAKDQPFGELHIGVPVEFGKAYFPAIVAAFRKHYPDVTFDLKLGDPNILLPLLRKGQLDFAIVDLFQTRNQYFGNLNIYDFNNVVTEEIILVCSRQYYEKHINQDHSFKHLAQQNFITYRKDAQPTNIWFKHHFGKINLSIEPVLNVNSHQAILSAIQRDVGMGIIASHLVRKEIQEGQIIGIKTSKSDIRNQMALTQLLDKIPTFTQKVFIKFLLKEIELIGLQIEGKKPFLKNKF